jgi:hypothetical protein
MATWVYDDGGRKSAGFRGDADDCVCRAIAIAARIPYRDVYRQINEFAGEEKFRRGKVGKRAACGLGSSARNGVLKETTRDVIASLGWTWHPTMQVGSGCRVHLRADELPPGRLIVKCSKHVVAVIDGVIHDTHDPSRNGTRCVYGYWTEPTT